MEETPALDPRNGASDEGAAGSRREASPAQPNDGAPSAAEGEREARLAAIRAAVERGLEDVKEGRVADLDAALDRIEAMLDEIEAAKRA